jgi:gliding motility-associated-like protein
MTRIIRILIIGFLLLIYKNTSSQIDTVFWFAAPWVTPDHTWKEPVQFHISSFGNPTTVRIRQPAMGTWYDTTFTMPANSIVNVTYWKGALAGPTTMGFDSLECRPANTVLRKGFKISSDNPITVVYDFVTRAPTFYNPETFSLKGQNGLGTEFVVPMQTLWNNRTLTGDLNGDALITQPKSQVNIVATDYNTVVWITPKCNVVGHPANVTYSVMLPNPGDVYTIENVTQTENVLGNNLGGTIIVSNKNIAVTIADDSVNPSGGGGCFDLMGDQIVPVDVVGKEYIINKGQLNAGSNESIFIVATDNFTQININDGTLTTYTINKGDTKQYSITQPLTYVSANKPVYLIHMSGFGCELGMAILPPLNCAGSNQVSFTRNNSQPFFLNIICRNGVQGNFILNGNPTLVPASAFTVVPGTGGNWVGAQINFNTTDIPPNSSNLLVNTADVFALGVFNGNTTTGGLYHYMSSFLRKVYVDAGSDINYCIGTNSVIPLNGNVYGATSTGSWTAINGTGTFSNPNSLNTNYILSTADTTQSVIQLLLTSTGNCTPKTDTVNIYIRKSPIVDAGNNVTLCKNNLQNINLNGVVQNALGAVWSTTGNGVFGNSGSVNTFYIPTPSDASSDSIWIKLTSTGNIYGCPDASDSIKIKFTNPPNVNAGSDVNVCTNSPTISLNGSITGATNTGIWTSNGSGMFNPSDTIMNTNYILSSADMMQSVIYIKLTSTNNGNCNAVSDSIAVNIIQQPSVNAGNNDTICASAGFVTVNGSVSGSATQGIWSTTGGGFFSNPNALSTTYFISASDTINGYVYLILNSQGGICPSVSDTVRIDILKAPFVTAGNDTSVCNNIAIPLHGNVTGYTNTGQWTSTGTGTFFPNNTALSGQYIPSLFDVATGTVSLILESTNNKGCSPRKDTVKISFIPAPKADFTYSTTCVNSPVIFNDASTATTGTITNYYWDFGDGSNTISQNAIHTYSLVNTYTVTHIVTGNNGCSDSVQKTIQVYPLPIANFTYQKPCEKSNTLFFDSSYINPGIITQWNWNFGDGNFSTMNNPVHTFSAPAIYNVLLTVTSSDGCVNSITKPVDVKPKPNADFSMTNNPTVANEVVYFSDFSTPIGNINNWYWNFGDSYVSNIQNPSHTYSDQGDYTITLIVTSVDGCIDTVQKDISVILLPQVPTGFSPNQDGNNDVLYVRGGPFKKLSFKVYNNWGQLIFESNDQSIGWDGTFKGEEQPIGVYVWILEVEMYNNRVIKKSGDVTLMR